MKTMISVTLAWILARWDLIEDKVSDAVAEVCSVWVTGVGSSLDSFLNRRRHSCLWLDFHSRDTVVNCWQATLCLLVVTSFGVGPKAYSISRRRFKKYSISLEILKFSDTFSSSVYLNKSEQSGLQWDLRLDTSFLTMKLQKHLH